MGLKTCLFNTNPNSIQVRVMVVGKLGQGTVLATTKKLLRHDMDSDAGASPTHQASQRGSGRQLDKPAQILKHLGIVARSLNESFKMRRTCIL
jgi:hypothetical protein